MSTGVPLEVRSVAYDNVAVKTARSRTFRRHMLASTREPYPLGIEAVAAVNLFKVDLWQAARMAARVRSSFTRGLCVGSSFNTRALGTDIFIR